MHVQVYARYSSLARCYSKYFVERGCDKLQRVVVCVHGGHYDGMAYANTAHCHTCVDCMHVRQTGVQSLKITFPFC